MTRGKLFEKWGPALAGMLLLAVSLAVVWGVRYPPMQDYPQNLFQAELTARSLRGQGIGDVYGVHLKATYSAFFVVVAACRAVMPLWAAGKSAISLYFVLTAWAAWRVMRTAQEAGGREWGALLLFPAAFNPIYFLGFLHFLYAMPLLLLALMNLRKSAERPWPLRTWGMHGAWVIVLLMVHPAALVMYGIVAATWALLHWREQHQRWRLGAGWLLSTGAALGWAIAGWLGAAGSTTVSGVYYDPLAKTVEFAADLVLGLGGVHAPDWASMALWTACGAVVVWSGARRGATDRQIVRDALVAGAVLFAGVCALPFGTANASYLNVRLVLGVYLLLAVAAAAVRISGWQAAAILALCLLLDGNSVLMQRRISQEIAEIEPLIAAMHDDARILPLLFNRDAAATDSYFFSLHLNDHFYYQAAKGGVSPYLLESPREGRAPVYFRPGMQPPAPPEYDPTKFRWERFGAYRYFLVRGGNESVYRYMERGSTLRVTSGMWRLYERSGAK